MSENLNEPQSRTEEILQNALGEEYDVTPQSRVEKLLEQVVEGGGSGSSLPSPTTADNGKVLGVDGGEYKLGEARTDIPTANLSRAGQVLGVGNTGKYTFMDKEPSIEKIVLNGAYAYKYGKLAIVSYTPAGISFPAMVNGSGGLYVVSGSMEVDYDKIGSSGVLGYGYDTTDKTKRYAVAVTASTASGKDTFFLLDVDTMTSVSTNKTFFGMFFIPCK